MPGFGRFYLPLCDPSQLIQRCCGVRAARVHQGLGSSVPVLPSGKRGLSSARGVRRRRRRRKGAPARPGEPRFLPRFHHSLEAKLVLPDRRDQPGDRCFLSLKRGDGVEIKVPSAGSGSSCPR